VTGPKTYRSRHRAEVRYTTDTGNQIGQVKTTPSAKRVRYYIARFGHEVGAGEAAFALGLHQLTFTGECMRATMKGKIVVAQPLVERATGRAWATINSPIHRVAPRNGMTAVNGDTSKTTLLNSPNLPSGSNHPY